MKAEQTIVLRDRHGDVVRTFNKGETGVNGNVSKDDGAAIIRHEGIAYAYVGVQEKERIFVEVVEK